MLVTPGMEIREPKRFAPTRFAPLDVLPTMTAILEKIA